MIHNVEFEIGGRLMTIETGKIAKQANGSVSIRYGDSMVITAACAQTEPRVGFDFFPLTVLWMASSLIVYTLYATTLDNARPIIEISKSYSCIHFLAQNTPNPSSPVLGRN